MKKRLKLNTLVIFTNNSRRIKARNIFSDNLLASWRQREGIYVCRVTLLIALNVFSASTRTTKDRKFVLKFLVFLIANRAGHKTLLSEISDGIDSQLHHRVAFKFLTPVNETQDMYAN